MSSLNGKAYGYPWDNTQEATMFNGKSKTHFSNSPLLLTMK